MFPLRLYLHISLVVFWHIFMMIPPPPPPISMKVSFPVVVKHAVFLKVNLTWKGFTQSFFLCARLPAASQLPVWNIQLPSMKGQVKHRKPRWLVLLRYRWACVTNHCCSGLSPVSICCCMSVSVCVDLCMCVCVHTCTPVSNCSRPKVSPQFPLTSWPLRSGRRVNAAFNQFYCLLPCTLVCARAHEACGPIHPSLLTKCFIRVRPIALNRSFSSPNDIFCMDPPALKVFFLLLERK